jgi:hypothetical protein
MQHAYAACTSFNFSSSPTPLKLFYRSQMVLSLLLGVVLVALPNGVIDASDSSFTAEVLVRRCIGISLGILGTSINWILLDAASTGTLTSAGILGGPTYRRLKESMGLMSLAVRVHSHNC